MIPLVLAIVCLVQDMYNPTAFFCYVVTHPIGCDHYEDVECIRGNHSWLWRSIAQIIPFGVCFLTIIYCMVNIYLKVKQQEDAVAQHQSTWMNV